MIFGKSSKDEVIEAPLSIIDRARNEVELNPGSPFYGILAEHLLKEGNTDEALSILRNGISANPEYLTGYIILGNHFFSQNQFAEARDEFNKVLEKDPQSLPALYGLSKISFATGDHSTGLTHLFQIISIDPYNNKILDELTKRREEIHKKFERKLAGEPTSDFENVEENIQLAKEKIEQENEQLQSPPDNLPDKKPTLIDMDPIELDDEDIDIISDDDVEFDMGNEDMIAEMEEEQRRIEQAIKKTSLDLGGLDIKSEADDLLMELQNENEDHDIFSEKKEEQKVIFEEKIEEDEPEDILEEIPDYSQYLEQDFYLENKTLYDVQLPDLDEKLVIDFETESEIPEEPEIEISDFSFDDDDGHQKAVPELPVSLSILRNINPADTVHNLTVDLEELASQISGKNPNTLFSSDLYAPLTPEMLRNYYPSDDTVILHLDEPSTVVKHEVPQVKDEIAEAISGFEKGIFTDELKKEVQDSEIDSDSEEIIGDLSNLINTLAPETEKNPQFSKDTNQVSHDTEMAAEDITSVQEEKISEDLVELDAQEPIKDEEQEFQAFISLDDVMTLIDKEPVMPELEPEPEPEPKKITQHELDSDIQNKSDLVSDILNQEYSIDLSGQGQQTSVPSASEIASNLEDDISERDLKDLLESKGSSQAEQEEELIKRLQFSSKDSSFKAEEISQDEEMDIEAIMKAIQADQENAGLDDADVTESIVESEIDDDATVIIEPEDDETVTDMSLNQADIEKLLNSMKEQHKAQAPEVLAAPPNKALNQDDIQDLIDNIDMFEEDEPKKPDVLSAPSTKALNQNEIEDLINNFDVADFVEDEPVKEEKPISEALSQDDIEALINSFDSTEISEEETVIDEKSDNKALNQDDIESLINSLDSSNDTISAPEIGAEPPGRALSQDDIEALFSSTPSGEDTSLVQPTQKDDEPKDRALSQDDIEALLSGTSTGEDSSSVQPTQEVDEPKDRTLSQDDIEALLSGTPSGEDSSSVQPTQKVDEPKDRALSQDDIEALLGNVNESSDVEDEINEEAQAPEQGLSQDDIEKLFGSLETKSDVQDENIDITPVSEDNFEDRIELDDTGETSIQDLIEGFGDSDKRNEIGEEKLSEEININAEQTAFIEKDSENSDIFESDDLADFAENLGLSEDTEIADLLSMDNVQSGSIDLNSIDRSGLNIDNKANVKDISFEEEADDDTQMRILEDSLHIEKSENEIDEQLVIDTQEFAPIDTNFDESESLEDGNTLNNELEQALAGIDKKEEDTEIDDFLMSEQAEKNAKELEALEEEHIENIDNEEIESPVSTVRDNAGLDEEIQTFGVQTSQKDFPTDVFSDDLKRRKDTNAMLAEEIVGEPDEELDELLEQRTDFEPEEDAVELVEGLQSRQDFIPGTQEVEDIDGIITKNEFAPPSDEIAQDKDIINKDFTPDSVSTDSKLFVKEDNIVGEIKKKTKNLDVPEVTDTSIYKLVDREKHKPVETHEIDIISKEEDDTTDKTLLAESLLNPEDLDPDVKDNIFSELQKSLEEQKLADSTTVYPPDGKSVSEVKQEMNDFIDNINIDNLGDLSEFFGEDESGDNGDIDNILGNIDDKGLEDNLESDTELNELLEVSPDAKDAEKDEKITDEFDIDLDELFSDDTSQSTQEFKFIRERLREQREKMRTKRTQNIDEQPEAGLTITPENEDDEKPKKKPKSTEIVSAKQLDKPKKKPKDDDEDELDEAGLQQQAKLEELMKSGTWLQDKNTTQNKSKFLSPENEEAKRILDTDIFNGMIPTEDHIPFVDDQINLEDTDMVMKGLSVNKDDSMIGLPDIDGLEDLDFDLEESGKSDKDEDFGDFVADQTATMKDELSETGMRSQEELEKMLKSGKWGAGKKRHPIQNQDKITSEDLEQNVKKGDWDGDKKSGEQVELDDETREMIAGDIFLSEVDSETTLIDIQSMRPKTSEDLDPTEYIPKTETLKRSLTDEGLIQQALLEKILKEGNWKSDKTMQQNEHAYKPPEDAALKDLLQDEVFKFDGAKIVEYNTDEFTKELKGDDIDAMEEIRSRINDVEGQLSRTGKFQQDELEKLLNSGKWKYQTSNRIEHMFTPPEETELRDLLTDDVFMMVENPDIANQQSKVIDNDKYFDGMKNIISEVNENDRQQKPAAKIPNQKDLEKMLKSGTWKKKDIDEHITHKYSVEKNPHLKDLLQDTVFEADEEAKPPEEYTKKAQQPKKTTKENIDIEMPSMRSLDDLAQEDNSNTEIFMPNTQILKDTRKRKYKDPKDDTPGDELDDDGIERQKELEQLLVSDIWKTDIESETDPEVFFEELSPELKELLSEDVFKSDGTQIKNKPREKTKYDMPLLDENALKETREKIDTANIPDISKEEEQAQWHKEVKPSDNPIDKPLKDKAQPKTEELSKLLEDKDIFKSVEEEVVGHDLKRKIQRPTDDLPGMEDLDDSIIRDVINPPEDIQRPTTRRIYSDKVQDEELDHKGKTMQNLLESILEKQKWAGDDFKKKQKITQFLKPDQGSVDNILGNGAFKDIFKDELFKPDAEAKPDDPPMEEPPLPSVRKDTEQQIKPELRNPKKEKKTELDLKNKNMITPTMAEIYVKQGHVDLALKIYQQLLSKANESQRAVIFQRIDQLRKQLGDK